MENMIIGPSTGWLYAIRINSLIAQEELLKNAGVKALEICLGNLNKDPRIISLREGEFKEEMDYKSLHIPDFNGNLDLEMQVKAVKEIVDKHRIKTALIHPLKCEDEYPKEYYEQMISAGISLAVENMDKNKSSGIKIKELEYLTRTCNTMFVLDIQHAFEHDSQMGYAKELLDAFKDNLVHLHVSGEEEGNNHCLVSKARNRDTLVKFLGKIFCQKKVPLIIEGEYRTKEDLKEEIEFLSTELCF